MKRLLIVNPNTNVSVTRWLAEEARRAAPEGFEIVAVNADSGLEALQTPEDIETAARAVVRAIAAHARAGGLAGAVIAAFGDPGLAAARALGLTQVVGLGESGLRAAAASVRRFSIVTLGEAMRRPVLAKAAALGLGAELVEVNVLPFSIAEMIADREATRARIVAAVRQVPSEIVLLGGAPFAGMALAVAGATGKRVLDGVGACVQAFTTGSAHAGLWWRRDCG